MLSISQYFTRHGIVGVLLFVGGHIGAAALLARMMWQPAYSPPGVGSYILLGACGFGVLISIPLMLIGRAYDVELRQLPKELRRSPDAS